MGPSGHIPTLQLRRSLRVRFVDVVFSVCALTSACSLCQALLARSPPPQKRKRSDTTRDTLRASEIQTKRYVKLAAKLRFGAVMLRLRAAACFLTKRSSDDVPAGADGYDKNKKVQRKLIINKYGCRLIPSTAFLQHRGY